MEIEGYSTPLLLYDVMLYICELQAVWLLDVLVLCSCVDGGCWDLSEVAYFVFFTPLYCFCSTVQNNSIS